MLALKEITDTTFQNTLAHEKECEKVRYSLVKTLSQIWITQIFPKTKSSIRKGSDIKIILPVTGKVQMPQKSQTNSFK